MSKKVIADPTPEDGFVEGHAIKHPSQRFDTLRQEAHDRIALEHEQFRVHEVD